MRSNKTLRVLVLGLVLITVASASLNGGWHGTSAGDHANVPGAVIYPWLFWSVSIIDDVKMTGTWTDGTNHGTSVGTQTKVDERGLLIFEGIWTYYYNGYFHPIGTYEIELDTTLECARLYWITFNQNDEGHGKGFKD